MTTAIGIDMGGTKTSAARVRSDGMVEQRTEVATPGDRGGQADLPARLAEALMSPDVLAIGVAVAATLQGDGKPEWSAMLSIAGVDLAGIVASRLELPVVVVNDASAAALAEARLGAGAGYARVVVLTFGTGIGGGIVLDGRLYVGLGRAGEFGHMAIDPNGPECPCGRRGCWGWMASGSALGRAASVWKGDSRRPAPEVARRRGEDVISAVDRRDPAAEMIWSEHIRRIIIGLLNVGAILDPDVIVMGGGLSRLGSRLIDDIRESMRDPPTGLPRWLRADLRLAHFGPDAGVVGAALAALDRTGVS